jgi:hypothetical protein
MLLTLTPKDEAIFSKVSPDFTVYEEVVGVGLGEGEGVGVGVGVGL